MTSPLKKTRDKKRAMIQHMHGLCFMLISFPRSSLDQMDYRNLKKVTNKLNELFERAKPYENKTNNLVVVS